MDKKEKKLIEELFLRLKEAEKSSTRDENAEKFIYDCYDKQKNSVYYMIQTILVQEVAIKKLNQIIQQLEEKNKNLSDANSKKTFLSGLMEKYIPNKKVKKENLNDNVLNNSNNVHKFSNPVNSENSNYTPPLSGSGFLGNALQTAAGVAGGIVAGNMLMNLFNKNHSEEEIFHGMHNNYIFPQENSGIYNHHENLNNLEHSESFTNNDSLNNTGNFQNIISEDDSNFIMKNDNKNEDNFLSGHQEVVNNDNVLYDDSDDDDDDDNF